MTTLRRQRPVLRAVFLGFCVCMVLAAGLWRAGHADAATTEQIVVDRNSGLALYGFDPVAYFADRDAKPGREDLELKHGGVAWRFVNEGNRAAFANDPDIYMPQYGGHDPVAIADGVGRDGHPDFWAIHDQKLFLFYSADARKAFERDPDGVSLQAEANWPHVSRTLVP